MARIRTIKPEFWPDAKLVKLPFEYRLLFIGLWNYADDKGFLENQPEQIKINIFPADDVDVARGIAALKKAERVEVVRLDGKSVIRILNWHHQRIDKPGPSKWAAPYDEYQAQRAIPRTFQERSQNVPAGREGKGGEGKGKDITQVGGGTHLSSAESQTPPPPPTRELLETLAEPWRCTEHQFIDKACLRCKDFKTLHKSLEAERVKTEKAEARAAELARRRAEREAEAATVDPVEPGQAARIIKQIKQAEGATQ